MLSVPLLDPFKLVCFLCYGSLAVPYETKLDLAYKPAFALLSIYPRELKTCSPRNDMNAHSNLFIKLKNWK